MALPGGGGGGTPRWFATVSWQNSGESGVTTKVYFGGPYGAPPASGTLPYVGLAKPFASSKDIDMGTSPTHGTYYAQVSHAKVGFTDSPLSPVAPVGAIGPAV